MPSSMTGYGRCRLARDGREMVVELKTVNHRFLDISLRLPRSVAFLEDAARTALGVLARGHVDVFVSYKNARPDARTVALDEVLLAAYAAAAARAAQLTGLPAVPLESLLRADVLSVEEAEEDREAVAALFMACAEGALAELTAMRRTEGARLAENLAGHAAVVAAEAEKIRQRAGGVAEEYRAKLEARLARLLQAPVDEARLAQEVAILADRASIDEELTRLASHTEEFTRTLPLDEPMGRKLDFIVQEMNREINTIGSKAGDAAVAAAVIAAKCEVEKLREQLQNLE